MTTWQLTAIFLALAGAVMNLKALGDIVGWWDEDANHGPVYRRWAWTATGRACGGVVVAAGAWWQQADFWLVIAHLLGALLIWRSVHDWVLIRRQELD